jgi:hypothetical protein
MAEKPEGTVELVTPKGRDKVNNPKLPKLHDFIGNSICLGDRVVTGYPYSASLKLVMGSVVGVKKKVVYVQLDDKNYPLPVEKKGMQLVVFARGSFQALAKSRPLLNTNLDD